MHYLARRSAASCLVIAATFCLSACVFGHGSTTAKDTAKGNAKDGGIEDDDQPGALTDAASPASKPLATADAVAPVPLFSSLSAPRAEAAAPVKSAPTAATPAKTASVSQLQARSDRVPTKAKAVPRAAKAKATIRGQMAPATAAHDMDKNKDKSKNRFIGQDKAGHGKGKNDKVVSGKKVVRYVEVDQLNVRASPRADAAVVAKLNKGSMVTAVVMGQWTQIGNGQFVQSKYLGQNRPHQTKTRHLARR